MARKTLTGKIVSTAMNKTVVVEISSLKQHPKYKKRYKVTNRYKAHVEEGGYKVGDRVAIEEMRPMSKTKRWRVVERISKNLDLSQEKNDKSQE